MTAPADNQAHSDGAYDEGRVYYVSGEDWDEVVSAAAADEKTYDERMVVNMGPQHPSTHGVLRLVLTLDGETVTELRPVIGYLHTGIEKNMEFRTWTQGVTFCTRMDYLSPLFNETAYCLAVERLLGHRSGDPRAGHRDPGPDDGAEPDWLTPDRHRHDGPGARRDDRVHLRDARAGEDA